jgi:hypothetical protein
MLLPEFRSFFRYSDLYPCRRKLSRRIELYTPLYSISKQVIKKSTEIPREYIAKERAKVRKAKADAKTP